MSSRASRSFHAKPKKHKSARKAKIQSRKFHDSDYDFDNYRARSMTPKRKVADLRIRALSLNFELFVRERELTFFVNEFLKMRCFQRWRRVLGRALLDRVTALKNRQRELERSRRDGSLHRSGKSSPLRDAGASFMLDPLSEGDEMQVTVTHTRPEVEQVKLDLSDEFVIAAINPKLEIVPSPNNAASEFVMDDTEDEFVSMIPKVATPLRSAEIPGRLSPKQIVEEEFQSVSDAKPPERTTSLEACPTLPDDLFSSNVYQRASRRGKKIDFTSEEETTTSTGEKRREVDILRNALRKISKSPSKSHAQRELKRMIFSEEYNESTDDDFRPLERDNGLEEESCADNPPQVRSKYGGYRGRYNDISDFSTDFSLSSTSDVPKAKPNVSRSSRNGRRELSEDSSSIDDGFRLTEQEEEESEATEVSAVEEESIDSSAAIEFLLRDPVSTVSGRASKPQ